MARSPEAKGHDGQVVAPEPECRRAQQDAEDAPPRHAPPRASSQNGMSSVACRATRRRRRCRHRWRRMPRSPGRAARPCPTTMFRPSARRTYTPAIREFVHPDGLATEAAERRQEHDERQQDRDQAHADDHADGPVSRRRTASERRDASRGVGPVAIRVMRARPVVSRRARLAGTGATHDEHQRRRPPRPTRTGPGPPSSSR